MKKFIKMMEMINEKIRVLIMQNKKEISLEILYKEKLFIDFLEVINSRNCLFVSEVNAAKRDFRLILIEPESYLKKLVENGHIEKHDYDISIEFLSYNLLADYILRFEVDIWRFDPLSLSKFIEEEINLPFEITFKQTDNDITKVIEKLETFSPYTLLNLDSKMDNYNLFLCLKDDKEKILELALILEFPIAEVSA